MGIRHLRIYIAPSCLFRRAATYLSPETVIEMCFPRGNSKERSVSFAGLTDGKKRGVLRESKPRARQNFFLLDKSRRARYMTRCQIKMWHVGGNIAGIDRNVTVFRL